MAITTAIALDVIVIVVLLLFIWRGAAKGCVLMLCGLLAVIVAYAGASCISNLFSEPVASVMQPYIQSHLEQLLEGPDAGDPSASGPISSFAPSYHLPALPSENENTSEQGVSVQEVLESLENSEIFAPFAQSISDAVQDGSVKIVTTAIAAVSAYLATTLAKMGLFFLSYAIILLVWWLLSHALDLAFHLPVLRTLNRGLGAVIGLVNGVLILFVVCWAVQVFHLIPQEVINGTFLFQLFLNFHVI